MSVISDNFHSLTHKDTHLTVMMTQKVKKLTDPIATTTLLQRRIYIHIGGNGVPMGARAIFLEKFFHFSDTDRFFLNATKIVFFLNDTILVSL